MTSVVAAAAVIFIGAGAAIYALARRHVVRGIDDELRSTARMVASVAELEEDKLDLELDASNLGGVLVESGDYLEMRLDEQIVFQTSPQRIAFHANLPDGVGFGEPGWTRRDDGRITRAVWYRFHPSRGYGTVDDQMNLSLLVALDATEQMAALRYLAAALVGVGAVGIVLLGIVMNLAIRRGLRPLGAAADEVSARDWRRLPDDLPTDNLPDEVRPFVDRINAMLGSLRIGIERERRFSSNVAHELRTPLAGLRTTLEVAGARQRSPEELSRAVETCRTVVLGMQHMIENLLTLARVDNNEQALNLQRVDVGQLVGRVWDEVAAEHRDAKPFDRQWSAPPGTTGNTDPVILGLALGNVFRNAIAYVDDGGRIEVDLRNNTGGLRIRVANTGSRLAPADAGHVVERFWRGDASRHWTGRHTGLGASIANEAVRMLGGRLSIRVTPDGFFIVNIELPEGGAA